MFRQLASRLPWGLAHRLIAQHKANKGVRSLSTEQMLLTLLLAQVSEARSLHDIEALPESQSSRRYHLGLGAVCRSTLADAAAKRPAAVFTGILGKLIARLGAKLPRGIGDWARFSAKLCGAKAHVVYDLDADCPFYLGLTPARVNDITAARDMPIEAGATYVFDLGHYNHGWWAKLDAATCRIVTRLKANAKLRVVKTLALPAEPGNILSDRIGFPPERLARSRRNPMGEAAVREIKARLDTGKVLRILSNDLDAPAEEIAALYERRWAIEPFFRWIKQTLKLRHFQGQSENAVRVQIAVALIAFVLIKLAHGASQGTEGLTRFGRLIRATVLHRKPLERLGRAGPPEAGPVQSNAQGVSLWA